MSFHRKRKLEDSSDDYSAGIEAEMSKFGSASTKRHTIDSDEEDEEDNEEDYNKKKYDVMNDDDIEGQEASTIEFDGGTKITPFNMQDELEEGYFDAQGTYIWNKKDASEIKDSWLDSIDWVKVKRPDTEGVEGSDGNNQVSSSSTSSSQHKVVLNVVEEEKVVDVFALYKELGQFLKKGESVLKAVKRLGALNKPLSASERLKQKKMQAKLAEKAGGGDVPASSSSSSSTQKSSVPVPAPVDVVVTDVEKVTEIANAILQATGNMDIYEETFESITMKVNREERKAEEKLKVTILKQDDGSDMFGDDF